MELTWSEVLKGNHYKNSKPASERKKAVTLASAKVDTPATKEIYAFAIEKSKYLQLKKPTHMHQKI
jgi:hypothetical protein